MQRRRLDLPSRSRFAAFTILCLSGLAAVSSCRSPDPSAQPVRYLALGDSYTIGESVSAEERFPMQLASSLRRGGLVVEAPTIIATTGWTTDELSAGLDAAEPQGPFDLVTLLIGVNNQYRGRDTTSYRTDFRRLLERSIEYSGGRIDRVFVLSIPDWGVMPFARGRDRPAIASEIDAFNLVNREETARYGAHYVDVTPASRRATQDTTLVASDGLHPSGRMYEAWTELLLPGVRAILQP